MLTIVEDKVNMAQSTMNYAEQVVFNTKGMNRTRKKYQDQLEEINLLLVNSGERVQVTVTVGGNRGKRETEM